MEMSSSQAQKATYVYGPYTLTKAGAAAKTPTFSSPTPKGKTVKNGPVTPDAAPGSKGDEELTADSKIYKYTGGDGKAKDKQSIKDIKKLLTTRLRAIKEGKKPNDQKILSCKTLIQAIIDENNHITEPQKDLLREQIEGHSQCSNRFANSFGGADEAPNEDSEKIAGSYDVSDVSALVVSTQEKAKKKSSEASAEASDGSQLNKDGSGSGSGEGPVDETAKPAVSTLEEKTPEEVQKESAKKSLQVSFDFWFYTGNETDAGKITGRALKDGVFEEADKDHVKVSPTTTTITSSSLCISSVLSTQVDTATPIDASESGVNPHSVTEPDISKVHVTPEFGAPKSKDTQQDVEIKKVDFSQFIRGCLISYIADTKNAKVIDVTHTEKHVYIFYTDPSACPETDNEQALHGAAGKKRPKEPVPDNLNKTTPQRAENKSWSLKAYVPSVLSEPVVLDAMTDLAVRCLEATANNYGIVRRAIQTMMLRGITYVPADDSNASQTDLVSFKSAASASQTDLQPSESSSASHLGGGGDKSADSSNAGFGGSSRFGTGEEVLSELMGILATKDYPSKWQIVNALYNINVSSRLSINQFLTLVSIDVYAEEKTLYVNPDIKEAPIHQGLVMYAAVNSDTNAIIYVTTGTISYIEKVYVGSGDRVPDKHSETNVTNHDKLLEMLKASSADDTHAKIAKWVGELKQSKAVKAPAKKNSQPQKDATTVKKANDPVVFRYTSIAKESETKTQRGLIVRALRILISNGLIRDVDATKRILDSVIGIDIASAIQDLDKFFFQYELDPEYKWKAGSLSANLHNLVVPHDDVNWHGGVSSLQRIVAQYAAAHNTVERKGSNPNHSYINHFTSGTADVTTRELLEMTIPEINDKPLYCTWMFVKGLNDQNFGALFTSQPNFHSLPFSENELRDFEKDQVSYKPQDNQLLPTCIGSELNRANVTEETMDLEASTEHAAALVKMLIHSKVLKMRQNEPSLMKLITSYENTVKHLDHLLLLIKNRGDIVTYITGEPERSVEDMLRASMKCFLMVAPIFLDPTESSYPSPDSKISKALSYGLMSHGLDPKHLLALRYTMDHEEEKYKNQSYELSRSFVESMFNAPHDLQVTRELMRTRVLGSIMIIMKETPDLETTQGFGRSYRGSSRRSMFI